MTLTVVIGSSGSGKTTFLNDVHASHKCTYIRQFHKMRPYIAVSKIPNFDPTQLPFWDIYVREGRANKIKCGGTFEGKFTPGFSGGQRKLLLFELIHQRTMDKEDLLICLDEPFSGVTDDFVPFIVGRLNQMRQRHNILLVTNDHVNTLKAMADNTITVSAVNRSIVRLNQIERVDRSKAIMALSVGDEFVYKTSRGDFKFFFDVEIFSNGTLIAAVLFTVTCFLLFIVTYWGSSDASAPLVVIAGGIIAFFCINPYMLSTIEWRNVMLEEAEALMHASKLMNKSLKATLSLTIIMLMSLLEYGVVNAVINGLGHPKFWCAMFMDVSSMLFPVVCMSLFTRWSPDVITLLGSLPLLLMIFFSTTYSPGSGIEVMKEFRYLFVRFYFWCMVPGIKTRMEGCPSDDVIVLYMCLAGLLNMTAFLFMVSLGRVRNTFQKKEAKSQIASMMDAEFYGLQEELYGKTGSASKYQEAHNAMDRGSVVAKLFSRHSSSMYTAPSTRASSLASQSVQEQPQQHQQQRGLTEQHHALIETIESCSDFASEYSA